MSNYGNLLKLENNIAIGDGMYLVQEWEYSEVEGKRAIYVYDNEKMITDENHDFGQGVTLKDFIELYNVINKVEE